MRQIRIADIENELRDHLKGPHPVEEDLGILDENGELSAVVISPDAYLFFLKKVEEEEDRLDTAAVRQFRRSGEKDL